MPGYRVVFSPAARARLVALHRYIAREASSSIAQQFTDALMTYCESFETFPHRGRRRDDLRPGLRTVGFRRRVTIAFVVEKETVLILDLFYGGQDFEAALSDDDEP